MAREQVAAIIPAILTLVHEGEMRLALGEPEVLDRGPVRVRTRLEAEIEDAPQRCPRVPELFPALDPRDEHVRLARERLRIDLDLLGADLVVNLP